MGENSKTSNCDFQELASPMPYQLQHPAPPYTQGVGAAAHQQAYHPKQQPMVYQPTQNVVSVGIGSPMEDEPVYNDYICWSVMNMLCCCQPLGLVALIFSCKTQYASEKNDLKSARSQSSRARRLNIMALIFGVISYIVIIVCLYYNSNINRN